MPIRILDRRLVDQIAAGEVVERPASVVKELVENALDAGATRIVVAVEGGGADRITVADDGSGIPADELPLAVASHATSKICRVEDLAAIGTMGFRGEALASIASVARVSITSRVRGADAAAWIEVEGGEARDVAPAAGAPGTVVEVRQLFFNVPARRKFLRSAATELGRIEETIEALALCRPGVAFRLEADGRMRLDLASTADPARRVRDILGASGDDGMLTVQADVDLGGSPVALWGMVGMPSLARGASRAMRFSLNGRAVLDRTLLHAAKEAYRGLMEPGRTPLGFIAIEMDPSLVDVNVHPAKTEVRFRQQQSVHSLVLRAVREALRAADLVPAFELARPAGDARASDFSEFAALAAAQAAHPAPSVVLVETRAPASAAAGADAPLHANRTARRVMQVHGSYLVVEDRDGILVVDQHALHERAMFETLSARIASAPLESQPMLVPVPVEVDARAAEAAEEARPLLDRLGIEVVPVGPRSVLVHAYPTFLSARGVEPAEFVPGLLARIAEDGPGDVESALSDVLDMMACKAAVKAGDRLSPAEIDGLLDLRERIERSSNCPHGRPTSLRISMRDLERSFGRA